MSKSVHIAVRFTRLHRRNFWVALGGLPKVFMHYYSGTIPVMGKGNLKV